MTEGFYTEQVCFAYLRNAFAGRVKISAYEAVQLQMESQDSWSFMRPRFRRVPTYGCKQLNLSDLGPTA
jgi:hypothetical protein